MVGFHKKNTLRSHFWTFKSILLMFPGVRRAVIALWRAQPVLCVYQRPLTKDTTAGACSLPCRDRQMHAWQENWRKDCEETSWLVCSYQLVCVNLDQSQEPTLPYAELDMSTDECYCLQLRPSAGCVCRQVLCNVRRRKKLWASEWSVLKALGVIYSILCNRIMDLQM